MPFSLSHVSPALPAHGFLPEFFKPHTAPLPSDSRSSAADNRPRTSYLPERDGSYAEFCDSENFVRYREEMRENIDFVAARCKKLGMNDAAEIEDRFHTLYRRRFDEAYYDTHAELIDSAGKRALDNFCAMLDDERLPAEKQRSAIRNLSQGVTVCASGTVRNLIDADRDLSLSSGGMRGKLWKAKEETVRAVLQDAVVQRYGPGLGFNVNEIHYVNAAWNHLADTLGLSRIPDWMMASYLDDKFLALCQDMVFAALSPDKIAKKIAEDCLSDFRSRTVFDPESPSVPCDDTQTEWLTIVAGDIMRDLGLAEGELSLHAFVQIDSDAQRYQVHDDPSLIALALLRVMNADRLLADVPEQVAEFGTEDGRCIALYSYRASLAWQLQQHTEAARAPSWDAHQDAEVMDVAGLRAWSKARGPDAADPPAATVRQLLRSTDPEDIMSVRAAWLGSADAILGLLKRLDAVQAIQYLGDNLSYLALRFPDGERAAFIDEVVHLGEPGRALARLWYSELGLVKRLAPAQAMEYLEENLQSLRAGIPPAERAAWADAVMHLGEPALSLVPAWYPHLWALLGEGNAAEGRTRLEHWIQSDNVPAIDAVRELMQQGWGVRDGQACPDSAIDQAFSCYDGAPIVQKLASSGSPAAVDALHRLLRQLLSGPPEIRDQLASRLPALFADRDNPPLLPASRARDAATIAAIHRMIVDPLILPHIAKDLPTILAGSKPGSLYPIWDAMVHGRAANVQAFGALLVDVAGVPGMEKILPCLLMPNVSIMEMSPQVVRSKELFPFYKLLTSSERDSYSQQGPITEVIKAYHALLIHPAILPHVQMVLHGLVPGVPDPAWRQSAYHRELLHRLFDTHLPSYAAYREMVKDPLIAPHVLSALPKGSKAIRARLAQKNPVVDAGHPGVRSSIADRIDRFLRRFAK
jgi:hypothetical protein